MKDPWIILPLTEGVAIEIAPGQTKTLGSRFRNCRGARRVSGEEPLLPLGIQEHPKCLSRPPFGWRMNIAAVFTTRHRISL